MSVDVLIIGGGPAGIAAAIEFKKQGRSYLILEAAARLGGRTLTSRVLGSDAPLDLGASWIHHSGPSNPMTQLAWQQAAALGVPRGGRDVLVSADGQATISEAEFDLATTAYEEVQALREELVEAHHAEHHAESPFRRVTYQQYISNSRQLVSADSTHADSTAFYDPSCRPSECATLDSTMASFLSGPGPSAIRAALPVTARAIFDGLVSDVEGFEGSPLSSLSVLHTGTELDGVPDCDAQVASGYGQMMLDVASKHQLEHELNTIVQRVEYGRDGVKVFAAKIDVQQQPPSQHGSSANPNLAPHAPIASVAGMPAVYRAKYCLVTVPLGVLKRGLIDFSPALPEWKLQAISSLGFGVLNKVMLRFDQPFWGDRDMSVLTVLGEQPIDAPADSPCTQPLWMVNMSPALSALQNMRAQQLANNESAHGPAWQVYMAAAGPLAPPYQLENDTGGDAATACPVAAAATGVDVAASASSPAPIAVSSAVSSPADGPHILISFHHGFDSADATSSSHEAEADTLVVKRVMQQLRRAFQGGVGKITDSNSQQVHLGTFGTLQSHPTVVDSTLVTVDSAAAEASAQSESLSLPSSYHFDVPTFAAATRPSVVVPEPSGYVVTRWGLEPYLHGGYAHYKPGSGPHTCAELSRPVSSVDGDADSTPRLLFAGEATLGVHLGCVDSAWLSGTREAKRVQHLWATREQ